MKMGGKKVASGWKTDFPASLSQLKESTPLLQRSKRQSVELWLHREKRPTLQGRKKTQRVLSHLRHFALFRNYCFVLCLHFVSVKWGQSRRPGWGFPYALTSPPPRGRALHCGTAPILTFGQQNCEWMNGIERLNGRSNSAAQRQRYITLGDQIVHSGKWFMGACCQAEFFKAICSKLLQSLNGNLFCSPSECDCRVHICPNETRAKVETPPCSGTPSQVWKHADQL